MSTIMPSLPCMHRCGVCATNIALRFMEVQCLYEDMRTVLIYCMV
jgi:hypothetical protein